jgi:hypothetical protein
MLPMLGRGKHRNPKKGACFMELASFLAGERWSDHPSCTHPLVAMLARAVNDLTSDHARPRLAPIASRIAISPARAAPLTRKRFAMFTQTMSSTSSVTPSNNGSACAAPGIEP